MSSDTLVGNDLGTNLNDNGKKGCFKKHMSIPRAKGITCINLMSYFYAALISVSAFVFVNAATPFILEHSLDIPKEEEGNYIGNLIVFGEVTSILLSYFWGSLSDKVGRKYIYIVSFFVMGGSIILMGFVTSFQLLVVYRMLFSCGVSAASGCITSLLADYPAKKGRGRAGGIIGLTSGLGALFALFIFLRIPLWTSSFIESVDTRGTVMFCSVAIFLLLSQFVLGFGLSPVKGSDTKIPFIDILKEGMKSIIKPKILLAYLGSFAARGDSIVITTFIVLWVQQYELSIGADISTAIAKAGAISGIAQTFALLFAVPAGFLAEKLDNVTFQTLSAFISIIGYGILCMLSTPTGVLIYVGVSIVGIGEIMMIIANSVLLSNEAPKEIRGALAGFQVILGAIAVIALTKLGGLLFDAWSPRAPFILLVLTNSIVYLYGQIYMIKQNCCDRTPSFESVQ